MRYFKKLVGKGVYLSPINTDDYETYCSWINDLTTSIPVGNTSNNIPLNKQKDILDHLSKSHAFAIVRIEDDQLVGNVALSDLNQVHRRASFSIMIGEEVHRNKGYGQEATSLMLSYAFNILNLNNVMLTVYAFNTRAIAAYMKVGFKEIGRRREAYYANGAYYDEIYFDLLASEFDCDVLSNTLDSVLKQNTLKS